MIFPKDLKKKMITIFPSGKNVHLVKDVGMIPYVLQKEKYYDSTIAFYEKEEKLPYLKTVVSGLKYKRIPKFIGLENFDIAIFLLFNYKKYDVLMLFHTFLDKAPLMVFFKALSGGRLKLYGKLDANSAILGKNYNKRSIKYIVGSYLYKKFDLLSVETEVINKFLNENSYMKTQLIPNGFINNDGKEYAKEKLIITVARIGAPEKDHHTFLNAISNLDLKDWIIKFIGPIEEGFKKDIDEFYKANPDKKDNVIFTGAIENRTVLAAEYKKAAVFVLTSISEGFPLVLTEALGNGCFIVTTNILAAFDVTSNGKLGAIVPMADYLQLGSIIQKIIDNDYVLPKVEDIKKFADDNFSWEKIASKIYLNLET